MESPDRAETPQDFVYKTKIVVLNYIGFGPPSFDLPTSPETLSGSETESLGSLASESGDDILDQDDNLPMPQKGVCLEEKRHSDSLLHIPEVSKLRSKSVSPKPSKKFAHSTSLKGAKTLQAMPKVMIDNAIRKRGSLKRKSTFEMHEQYQNALRELLMVVEDGEVSDPSSIQKDSAEDWHIQYQKAMKELIVSVQKEDEIHHSPQNSPAIRKGSEFTMHDQFQKAMLELSVKFDHDPLLESGLMDPLCPLSREALVAERIAQIGDRIMESHGRELEQALRTVMESNDGKLSYALFKAVLKETIKSQVPDWYHLAVTLNFTRHLALGLLWSGSRGLESVSDFATRYIEENLAEAILDHGGWDAITCINLDDLDGDSLSSISSGAASPYTPDVLSAAGSGPSVQSLPPAFHQESVPTLTLKGPWNTSSGGTSSDGTNQQGIPGWDLSLKLEKLSLNQDHLRDGQDESGNGKLGDGDEADGARGTDENAGGDKKKKERPKEEQSSFERGTEGTQNWLEYGEMALASAALAGLTAGMYALLRR